MPNFLDDNLNQTVFFDINYLDVLGSNTFEYCLYHLLKNDGVVADTSAGAHAKITFSSSPSNQLK